jgi:hypothetical protein
MRTGTSFREQVGISRTGEWRPNRKMQAAPTTPRHDGAMETVECRTLDVAELLEKHDVTSAARSPVVIHAGAG